MANKFILKRSSVAGKVPLPADLQVGELAVNLTDKLLYTKDANNAVQLLNAGAGVASFNTRTGAVTLQSADVTGALGFTPISSSGSISGSAGSASFLTKRPDYQWSASSLPTSYAGGMALCFVQTPDGWPNFGTVLTAKTLDGGGGALQMYVPYGPNYGGKRMRVRFGDYETSGGNAWTPWKTLVHAEADGSVSIGDEFVLAGGIWPLTTRGTNRGTYTKLTGTEGFANYFATSDGAVVSGWISLTGNATAYISVSDYRLKENVRPMSGALERNGRLKPCTYTWKADGSRGEGFIAHELQEVIPAAVSGQKDAVDENGAPLYQGVDTSFVVPHLVACIEELKAENDNIQGELQALKEQVAQLVAAKG